MIKDYERQALLRKSLENIVAGVAVGHTCSDEALRVLANSLIHAQKSEQRKLVQELPLDVRVFLVLRRLIKLRGSNHAKTKPAAG
jgi:hypothetical protein